MVELTSIETTLLLEGDAGFGECVIFEGGSTEIGCEGLVEMVCRRSKGMSGRSAVGGRRRDLKPDDCEMGMGWELLAGKGWNSIGGDSVISFDEEAGIGSTSADKKGGDPGRICL